MDWLVEYGMFLLKAMTLVIAVLITVGGIVALSARNKEKSEGELDIEKINDELDEFKSTIESHTLSKSEFKQHEKALKKKKKEEEKAEKKRVKDGLEASESQKKKKAYWLSFDGDVGASDVDTLRKEITAILTQASADDEVVLSLESPGGMVHSYGLAASQLKRIRDRGINLTVCVDRVAASGGYMMASLANRIIAAPFAIVGSIGVVAELPNFHRLLKKHDVDYETFTAGEHKRTVTVMGHNSEQAKEKFQQDLEDTHGLFKDHVKKFRPRLDIDRVANGDIWYGQQALDLKLIDEIGTSDDYIMRLCEQADVYKVSFSERKTLAQRLGFAAQSGVENALMKALTFVQQRQQMKS